MNIGGMTINREKVKSLILKNVYNVNNVDELVEVVADECERWDWLNDYEHWVWKMAEEIFLSKNQPQVVDL